MTLNKVLITGGNGNLGSLVASDFENRGVEVVVYDLPHDSRNGSVANHDRCFIEGDIQDTDLLEDTLKHHKPDAIIHLASLLSGSSEANPDLAWKVNATAVE